MKQIAISEKAFETAFELFKEQTSAETIAKQCPRTSAGEISRYVRYHLIELKRALEES